MNLRKRRLQIFGALFVSLLLGVGIYILHNDLNSLISQEKSVLKRTAQSLARLSSISLIMRAAATKDSQTSEDSQLKEQLIKLRSDLNIQGFIHIIDFKDKDYKVVASTNAVLDKGDPYLPPEDPIPTSYSNRTSATSFYRKDGAFFLTAYSPIKTVEAKTVAILALESNMTPFFYKIAGFALHYLLLVIGMLTIGGFLYNSNLSGLRGQLAEMRIRFQTLFNSSTAGVLVIDKNGKIERANQQAEDFLEVESDRMRNQPLFSPKNKAFLLLPLESSKNILKEVFEKKVTLNEKAKLILDGNRIKYLSCSISPIVYFGKTRGALMLFNDLSPTIIDQPNELIKKEEKFSELRDPLTNLLNIRYLLQMFEGPKNRSESTMLVVHIGHLDHLLESKGREEQNRTIKAVAKFLTGFFRQSDNVIRSQDDEFIVILNKTKITAAAHIAENVLKKVESAEIPNAEFLDITAGVAELKPKDGAVTCLERAEKSRTHFAKATDRSV